LVRQRRAIDPITARLLAGRAGGSKGVEPSSAKSGAGLEVLARLRCRVREDGAKRRPQRPLAPKARLNPYRKS
jgi:hypothetical protein